MSDAIQVPKELLQILFDTAVGSMDFGSGFLGDDEVYALRQTAELLGVDPMEGTPYDYRKRMAHAYSDNGVVFGGRAVGRCRWCSQPPESEIHNDDPAARVGGGE